MTVLGTLTPRRSATREALAGLRTTTAPEPASIAQSVVDTVTGWLAHRTSRRGFLVKAGVVGTAIAVDPFGYVLRPGTAYAAVCGPGAACSSGWTAFCATVNKGVNACPPGSIAAGWWKMDGASLCGGRSRYIVDCNATCARCSTPGSRAGICAPSCWSCTCTCGPSSSCDQRRTCCNSFRYGQCNTQVRQVGAVQCRVVSCTPPWVFENCSTSPATDNRTRDHNSSELPQAFTAITRRYISLGENGSRLGATVYSEMGVPGGRAQRYQKGRISAGPKGAFETVGPISARYVALGAEGSMLGFPLTGDNLAPGGKGRATRFANGRISYSAETGAWETVGPLAECYRAFGAEGGMLGYPVSGHRTAPDGKGRSTRFTNGQISYTPATGAHEIVGPLAELYRALGGEGGTLGYPVTGHRTSSDGASRHTGFTLGRISYSAATGAHWAGQQIATEYVRLGAETGTLKMPTTDQAPVTAAVSGTGQVAVTYQGGTLTYDPATGRVTRS